MRRESEAPKIDDTIQDKAPKSNVIALKSRQQIEKELKEQQLLKTLIEKASKLTW